MRAPNAYPSETEISLPASDNQTYASSFPDSQGLGSLSNHPTKLADLVTNSRSYAASPADTGSIAESASSVEASEIDTASLADYSNMAPPSHRLEGGSATSAGPRHSPSSGHTSPSLASPSNVSPVPSQHRAAAPTPPSSSSPTDNSSSKKSSAPSNATSADAAAEAIERHPEAAKAAGEEATQQFANASARHHSFSHDNASSSQPESSQPALSHPTQISRSDGSSNGKSKDSQGSHGVSGVYYSHDINDGVDGVEYADYMANMTTQGGDEEDLDDYKEGGYHPCNIGETFKNGRYLIIRKLGWGYFSTVWLARDREQDDTYVALKVVRAAQNYTETAIDEVKLLKRINLSDPNHPGREYVVRLHDQFMHVGPNGAHVCMVFEVLGENLLSLMKRYHHKGIPPILVKQIAMQVLLALDYTHRKCGIIHTDIKPENVLIRIQDVGGVLEEMEQQLRELEGWDTHSTSGQYAPSESTSKASQRDLFIQQQQEGQQQRQQQQQQQQSHGKDEGIALEHNSYNGGNVVPMPDARPPNSSAQNDLQVNTQHSSSTATATAADPRRAPASMHSATPSTTSSAHSGKLSTPGSNASRSSGSHSASSHGSTSSNDANAGALGVQSMSGLERHRQAMIMGSQPLPSPLRRPTSVAGSVHSDHSFATFGSRSADSTSMGDGGAATVSTESTNSSGPNSKSPGIDGGRLPFHGLTSIRSDEKGSGHMAHLSAIPSADGSPAPPQGREALEPMSSSFGAASTIAESVRSVLTEQAAAMASDTPAEVPDVEMADAQDSGGTIVSGSSASTPRAAEADAKHAFPGLGPALTVPPTPVPARSGSRSASRTVGATRVTSPRTSVMSCFADHGDLPPATPAMPWSAALTSDPNENLRRRKGLTGGYTALEEEHVTVKIADFGSACSVEHHYTDDIQTRQYRAPEVLVGANWGAGVDCWSVACMIFELLTGDYLFEPQSSATYSKDEDHVAQIIELLGQLPPHLQQGTFASQFFDSRGRLRNIHNLKVWPLYDVFVSKYEFQPDEARQLCDLLLPLLSLDPAKRADCGSLVNSEWLRDTAGFSHCDVGRDPAEPASSAIKGWADEVPQTPDESQNALASSQRELNSMWINGDTPAVAPPDPKQVVDDAVSGGSLRSSRSSGQQTTASVPEDVEMGL